MERDYYEILGVNPGADSGKIRSAYRKKAKELHPDTSGTRGKPEAFLELEEAYGVLKDREKKKAYDEKISPGDRTSSPKPRAAGEHETADPFETYEFRFGGSLFDTLWGGGFWSGDESSGGAAFGPEETCFEIELTPREASRGVSCPLPIVLHTPCDRCGGRGHSPRGFPCLACRGTGRTRRERTIHVRIPPGTSHGTRFEVSYGGQDIVALVLVH